MIESLVEQIEARFQDAQAQMSDPEVIGDRQRYAEAGASSTSSPGRELAEEWRHAKSDAEGAEEMLAEGGDDPELRARWRRRGRGWRSSGRRSGSRWSSATPTTTRT
jgi:peptide chain release factor 1